MRRYILLLAALMLTTYASAGILPKLQFGLRAGMDYQVNDFKSAIEEIDLKSSTGWFGGAHATLSWGMLGIRPELIYSQNKFDIESLDGSVNFVPGLISTFTFSVATPRYLVVSSLLP